MRKLLLAVAFTGVFASLAEAQQVRDPRVVDLVQAGKIRIALFLPQYTKDAVTGEMRGHGRGIVYMEVARALAARLGVEVQLAGHPSPREATECLKSGACDLGFLGINPSRAAELGFAPPLVLVPFTYLVPAGSSIRNVGDADRPGVRIAVTRNHESAVALTRILKHASLVYAETPAPTFELLRTGQVDTWASTLPGLLEYAAQLPGSRVLEDRYGENVATIAVPKSQAGWLSYFTEFVEEVKASGLVQRAIDLAGERGTSVAPPGKLN